MSREEDHRAGCAARVGLLRAERTGGERAQQPVAGDGDVAVAGGGDGGSSKSDQRLGKMASESSCGGTAVASVCGI